MKSIVIVESSNDKYFIEKLRDVLGLKNIELKEPICYECLNELSEKKLQITLTDIKFSDYQKIGIIIDADNEFDAIRNLSPVLYSIRRGKIILEREPQKVKMEQI